MIPKDPIILLSYLNMKLRDYYPSLGELCMSMDLNKAEIENMMEKIGYAYDEQHNQFR